MSGPDCSVWVTWPSLPREWQQHTSGDRHGQLDDLAAQQILGLGQHLGHHVVGLDELGEGPAELVQLVELAVAAAQGRVLAVADPEDDPDADEQQQAPARCSR